MNKLLVLFGAGFLVLLAGSFALSGPETKDAVRIGHFPNVTHAQALIGKNTGAFEKKFAGRAAIEWTTFNAGPSVIEAIFAGHLDIAYIGPSPAVNGYVKSQGQALRVIAGASSGGAALVVRKDAGISTPQDLHGKKIASPQLGNTQDVSLRAWLKDKGLKLKEYGGDVSVLPISNADQQTLFLKKEIDGAWTIEPWVSLLVAQAEGKVFLDEASLWPEGRYATTLVIVREKFLREHRDLVQLFLETHRELTTFIEHDPAAAKRILNDQLEKETHKRMPEDVLDRAFGRIQFTADPMRQSVLEQARSAFQAGFLKKEPDLSGLFEDVGAGGK